MTDICGAVNGNWTCIMAAGHKLPHAWDRRWDGQPLSREAVHHPEHYGGDTTYEAIKVIDAWGLGFCLGNCVKYICRADKKGTPLQDLKKAAWYLNHYIEQLEKEAGYAEEGRSCS